MDDSFCYILFAYSVLLLRISCVCINAVCMYAVCCLLHAYFPSLCIFLNWIDFFSWAAHSKRVSVCMGEKECEPLFFRRCLFSFVISLVLFARVDVCLRYIFFSFAFRCSNGIHSMRFDCIQQQSTCHFNRTLFLRFFFVLNLYICIRFFFSFAFCKSILLLLPLLSRCFFREVLCG